MPFDLRDLANSVAAALGQGGVVPGAPQRLWQDTQAFALRLLHTATQQWLPFYVRQEPCHVAMLRARVAFPCEASSILRCDVCQLPTCLNHAQIDQHGHGTCYGCVAEMIRLKRGAAAPGPGTGPAAGSPEAERDARLKAAFQALDLEPTASWQEVQARHRKLAAKNHPDRVRTPAAKAKAAQKSVTVNSAFAELKKHFGERAA